LSELVFEDNIFRCKGVEVHENTWLLFGIYRQGNKEL